MHSLQLPYNTSYEMTLQRECSCIADYFYVLEFRLEERPKLNRKGIINANTSYRMSASYSRKRR